MTLIEIVSPILRQDYEKNLIDWVKLKGPGSSTVPETKHIGHFIRSALQRGANKSTTKETKEKKGADGLMVTAGI